MRITDILHQIDDGYIVLPEFQRPFVWNEDQICSLLSSLYHRYFIGYMLLCSRLHKDLITRGITAKGDRKEMILDGQQRITSIYAVVRGLPPPFYLGENWRFDGLHFHVDREVFEFCPHGNDPKWLSVTRLFKEGYPRILDEWVISDGECKHFGGYIPRLARLHGILDINLRFERFEETDLSMDALVTMLDAIDCAGTPYSQLDRQRRHREIRRR